MNIQIIQIYRFERLRDGGSLIVSFGARDSCKYWLMFPKIGGDIENPEYGKPELVNRTIGIEVSLSIENAVGWLDKLAPLLEEREELPYVTKKEEFLILRKMQNLCNQHT